MGQGRLTGVRGQPKVAQRSRSAWPRSPVLGQHLVELRRGHEEQYRRDRVEALRPLLPLRPLTADVDEYEGHVVDVDRALRYALGGLPAVQDVLVGGYVVGPRYALQLAEEIAHRVTLESCNNDELVIPVLIAKIPQTLQDYYRNYLTYRN